MQPRRRATIPGVPGGLKLTMSPTAQIRVDCRDPAELPLDIAALHAQFDGDAVFVRRLCQTFVTSTSRLLDELTAAAIAGQRTDVRAHAHKIKGASHNVHATRLATLAATIETDSACLSLPELSRAIDGLRVAFDELIAHVSAELR